MTLRLKQLDAAILKTGIHEVLLMMQAASSIFDVVENDKRKPCYFYSWSGSNGGDAYGVAMLGAIAGKAQKFTRLVGTGRSRRIGILWWLVL